jgi:prepilin-type N-terminal cleavage/methylation domain-containing protein
MTLRKMLTRNQIGFTLIEVIIGIAICGMLGGGIVTAIYQIGRVSDMGNARVTAVKQVENALFYINRDVQMAQNPIVGTNSSFPLTLSWKSWEDNVQHQITYNLNSAGNLTRNNGTTTSTVAKFIDTDNGNTNWTYDSNSHKMTVVITATVIAGHKQSTETRKVEIIPRPGS